MWEGRKKGRSWEMSGGGVSMPSEISRGPPVQTKFGSHPRPSPSVRIQISKVLRFPYLHGGAFVLPTPGPHSSGKRCPKFESGPSKDLLRRDVQPSALGKFISCFASFKQNFSLGKKSEESLSGIPFTLVKSKVPV